MARTHSLEHSNRSTGDKLKRATAGLLLSTLGVTGLAACDTGARETGPMSEPVAEAPVTPSEQPSIEVTTTPTPEETESLTSRFVVDYGDFENWDSLTPEEKTASCTTLFEQNGFTEPVPVSIDNTGPEILDSAQGKISILWELNKDKSDERNSQVAVKALDCITSLRGNDDYLDTRNIITRVMDYVEDSPFDIPMETIDHVTRYSDGVDNISDINGNRYDYKVVEYISKTELDDAIVQEIFEWTPYGDWRSVKQFPESTAVQYGEVAPIILDPMRENTQWEGKGVR